jgi:hypothetical protein
MSKLMLYGRPVVDVETHLDGVDSFIESACWDDTGLMLTDSELDDLQDAAQDYLVQENCERFGYYKK